MVEHDVLKDCANHALAEWRHAEFQGDWHPLPAAEDVWEGRWLTGFHFQVAVPGGAGTRHMITSGWKAGVPVISTWREEWQE